MSASCGAGSICLQSVLLKVEDELEGACIYEMVDIGGCPLQSCQTYSLVYVNPTDSPNGLRLQWY